MSTRCLQTCLHEATTASSLQFVYKSGGTVDKVASDRLDRVLDRNRNLGLKVQMLEQEVKEAQRSREANKNSAPTVAVFPESADLLNQLKARRKKSRADLADVETFLEIVGSES
ncbi:hypothetical protein [Microcoleus sp. BROC3]|uniref:hypothetical protein n=1 Tax=Microcoleus sp. BROC3 TaxID=3055323 RepID=UPI002FD77D4A